MADLGTVSIVVDIHGQPMVKELARDFDAVTIAEKKVSDATQKVMAEFNRTREIMGNLKKMTDDTGASFQRFSAKELQQAGQRMRGFESTLANTRRGMGQMGMATQQIGYQVGDFLVQIQSGTNWMVAFGQQATQLVGVLPSFSKTLGVSVGSLIGISSGLGIAIPLLTAIGAAFMRTSSDADKGANSVGKYAEALKGLRDSLRETQTELDKLSFGTEDATMAAALVAKAQADIEVALARANQRKIGNAIVPTAEEAQTLRDAVLRYNEISNIVRDLEFKNKALAEAQRMLNGGLSVAAGIQRGLVYEKQLELRAAKELAREHAQQLSYMGKTRQESDNFVASLKSAYAILGASRVVAAGLADEMARAASAYITANSRGGSDYMANQYSTYGKGRVAGEVLAKESGKLYGGISVLPEDKKKGGGGAGAMTTAENRMEEIYKYLETDKYLIEQQTIAFEQRQATLEDALKKKIVTLEEYNQIEKDLTNKHQTEVADIENKAKMAKISTVLGVGAQILTALGEHNEKAAKMARIFGAAQALADTYAGAAAALKLPFPKNLVAAGSIISAGLGFVSAIKSGSSTSVRGGGGSVGSATVAASGNTAPAPQTVFIDSLDPDGLYSGQALINLFDAFYDENDKRGKVFLVAR
jgi:hypothetical protein